MKEKGEHTQSHTHTHTHTPLPGDLRGPVGTMVGYSTQGQGVALWLQQESHGLYVCTQCEPGTHAFTNNWDVRRLSSLRKIQAVRKRMSAEASHTTSDLPVCLFLMDWLTHELTNKAQSWACIFTQQPPSQNSHPVPTDVRDAAEGARLRPYGKGWGLMMQISFH